MGRKAFCKKASNKLRRMYGAPVYGAPVYGGAYPASVPYGGVVPGYGTAVVAGNSAQALALDAADGVIDGRIGGAPIANMGGAVYGAPMPVMAPAVVAPAPVVYAPPAVVPTTHYTTHVTYY